MRFELFVALRYLFARRKQAFIYVISFMSVLGVALGVGALIIVFGVYNGFTTDIRDKILGANAHVIVTGDLRRSLPARETADPGTEEAMRRVLDTVRAVPGVDDATDFVYAEGMISSPRGVKGVVVRGVDPEGADRVIGLLRDLSAGSVRNLAPESGPPGVIVGRELAARLGLDVGDRVNLLSPAGQRTASGFQPRIRPFRVAGLFHSGMYEYDSSLVFVSLPASRELLGLPEDYVTGLEVTVDDVYAADKAAERVAAALGPAVLSRHWMEMNANLFAALKLERIGMFIVLSMVVLVGSFSIVTSLVMLVMEKTRDIAVLMSMGASSGVIRRIFMLQGTIIGLVGTLLGSALGIGIGELLQRYRFIKLPPGVYTIDHLPVLLRWEDIVLVGSSALILCFLATVYPARQAAGLQPAEALRYE